MFRTCLSPSPERTRIHFFLLSFSPGTYLAYVGVLLLYKSALPVDQEVLKGRGWVAVLPAPHPSPPSPWPLTHTRLSFPLAPLPVPSSPPPAGAAVRGGFHPSQAAPRLSHGPQGLHGEEAARVSGLVTKGRHPWLNLQVQVLRNWLDVWGAPGDGLDSLRWFLAAEGEAGLRQRLPG